MSNFIEKGHRIRLGMPNGNIELFLNEVRLVELNPEQFGFSETMKIAAAILDRAIVFQDKEREEKK